MSALPQGWDLARLRAESGDATVHMVLPAPLVSRGGSGETPVTAAVAIDFSGSYLVRLPGDESWLMGELHPDGVIACWGAYGPDLGAAIAAL